MNKFLYIIFSLTLLCLSAFADDIKEAGDALDKNDYRTALMKYKNAASRGNAFAQLQVGNIFFTGGNGINKNYVEAVRWYKLAADQGYADGQHNLGTMFEEGNGVLQDYVEAVKYYRMAASQGLAISQNSLGFMYWEGKGVTRDLLRAHMWMNLSASQGFDLSSGFREKIARTLSQDQVEVAQRMARECKSTNYRNCK